MTRTPVRAARRTATTAGGSRGTAVTGMSRNRCRPTRGCSPMPWSPRRSSWRRRCSSPGRCRTRCRGSCSPSGWPVSPRSPSGPRYVTGSLFLSGYLLTWGVFLTAWLTWERFAGPWHEIVLGGLFIPAAVLAPAGAVAVGHHKEAVERARRTDADRAAARELRRWERILDRHGAPGCTVLDVRELRDGGMEVRGRLGKATDSRRAITYDTLCQAAPEIAVSQRSDRDGAYFSQPPDASAADFILHVRPKRHGERPAVHLPMEDRPLTVNRPMGFGVLDNGREYRLLLREVCVLIIGVRDAGKALSTDTPLATPSGWTTMGEIQAGDQVFDEAGQPCTVLAATGVLHGRPCY